MPRAPASVLLEHCLDLELDGDPVAHHRAAGLHDRAEVDAEVAPVDLADGAEPGTGAPVGVRPEAVDLQSQLHVPGHALQRELPVENVDIPVLAHAGGPEGHRRVGLDLGEVGRPDVRGALLVAGVDRGKVDLRAHSRAERVRACDNRAGGRAELAAYLAYLHVTSWEDLFGMDQVYRQGAGQASGDAGQGG